MYDEDRIKWMKWLIQTGKPSVQIDERRLAVWRFSGGSGANPEIRSRYCIISAQITRSAPAKLQVQNEQLSYLSTSKHGQN
jgi:hypothetical protein